jgi:glucose/arabinose dehydrogenase
MSTTFTTALSTPMTGNTNNSIRRRRTKLFFGQIYYYVTVTIRFVYSMITIKMITAKPAKSTTTTTTTTTTTKNIPSNASQYYKNKTLILDLDETLVHSVRLGSANQINNISPSIIRKNIEVQCDKQSLIYEVYKRPHVDFFLKTVSYILS